MVSFNTKICKYDLSTNKTVTISIKNLSVSIIYIGKNYKFPTSFDDDKCLEEETGGAYLCETNETALRYKKFGPK